MFDYTPEELQRLIGQDEQMFARFYEQTVDVFYRYVNGRYFLSTSEIEDLLSDIYLKCWK